MPQKHENDEKLVNSVIYGRFANRSHDAKSAKPAAKIPDQPQNGQKTPCKAKRPASNPLGKMHEMPRIAQPRKQAVSES
jgi:hypothetical protein